MIRSKKIQVVVDGNVHATLNKMARAGMRGKSTSEVAYTILDEWLWHNQEKLIANGIEVLAPKRLRKN